MEREIKGVVCTGAVEVISSFVCTSIHSGPGSTTRFEAAVLYTRAAPATCIEVQAVLMIA